MYKNENGIDCCVAAVILIDLVAAIKNPTQPTFSPKI
jgi:hypothetical protein